jgi:hypothetical protein
MKNNEYKLSCKFGEFLLFCNGVESFYITNRQDGYGKHPLPFFVRNKEIHVFSFTAKLAPNGLIDGRSYGLDGNTMRFVEGEELYKSRCMYATKKGERAFSEDATTACKLAIYDEVLAVVNKFYLANKAQIQAEWNQIGKADLLKEIEEKKTKIAQLEFEKSKLEIDLAKLRNDLIECPV